MPGWGGQPVHGSGVPVKHRRVWDPFHRRDFENPESSFQNPIRRGIESDFNIHVKSILFLLDICFALC